MNFYWVKNLCKDNTIFLFSNNKANNNAKHLKHIPQFGDRGSIRYGTHYRCRTAG